ncbi:MAG: ABC transporter ATP-binding protein [Acidimicrobiales bacterium]
MPTPSNGADATARPVGRVAAFLDSTRPSAIWGSSRVLLVRQLPGVSRLLTFLTLVGMVVGAVLTPAFTIATGVLVGRIPAAVTDGLDGGAGSALYRALAIVALLYVAQLGLLPMFGLAQSTLARRFDRHISNRLTAAALAPPSIAHLEDPAVLDQIAKAEGLIGSFTPGGAVNGMVQMYSTRLAGIGSLLIIGRFRWWLAVAISVAVLLERAWWRRLFDDVTIAIFDKGQIHRRSNYFRDAALTPEAAKELRVFSLESWIGRRFDQAWREAMATVWPKMKGRPTTFLVTGLAFVVQIGTLATVVLAGIDGQITLAVVVMTMSAVFNASSLGAVGDWDHMISEGVATIPVMLELEQELLAMRSEGGAPATGLPKREIRFESVSFCYAGRPDHVYTDLDLTIRAGESLAIVGANGAGKTTLVKLLARLHVPTGGRITVDGIPVEDLDATDWQTRIAAIFQDFQRWELAARYNVGYGAPAHHGDMALVERAADRAGALSIIEGLESGWDTPLSRQMTGGTDLSGGQWQRLALARALMAVEGGAGVLVLDEPTANLDVRTEAEIYERFFDLTAGLTTIVISHRFSTVRRADRIVVLDEGRVVEDGNHDSLMALAGTYARLFTLQASRYWDDPESDPTKIAEAGIGG